MAAARRPTPTSATPEATARATSRWEPSSGPVDVVRGDPGIGEQLVEQDSRAGAGLPPGDARRGAISGRADRARVAEGDEQALFPPPQPQQVRAAAARRRARERRVVGAAEVSQVDGRSVGSASAQCAQPLKAPEGADGDDRGASRSSTTRNAGSSLPAERNTRSASSRRAAAIPRRWRPWPGVGRRE